MLKKGDKNMEYSINPIETEDREPIIDIFNYYIANSFAAFPESKLPYQAFDFLLQMSKGYPSGTIKDEKGKVIGFGLLHTYNSIPTFAQTAEITYFLHHEHTRTGLGKKLLDFLEREGRDRSITTILANISSLNRGSINFHRNNGFIECGRFMKVGKKNGQLFDTVWMQKML
jgi:L-amino acid N-acyltransferase YncA